MTKYNTIKNRKKSAEEDYGHMSSDFNLCFNSQNSDFKLRTQKKCHKWP